MLTRAIDGYREETKETIVSCCRLLGLNRQIYYRQKKSIASRQETAAKVVDMIIPLRQLMPRLGTRKLYYLLQEPLSKLGVGRDRLFTILKANHLLIKPQRSYHITTNSHHRFRKHKNLIVDMELTRPEQLWVSDITYVSNRGKHRYLALITDAYSKKVVGYDLSNSLSTQGSLRALRMAVKSRIYKDESLIHHSDRGFQYCSNEYQQEINTNRIVCSMTESYDPYANAVAERINGILKQEFSLGKYDTDIGIMKKLVKNSIGIYNRLRPHYSCYMLTPNQMHKQRIVRIRTYKKKIAASLNLQQSKYLINLVQ